MTDEQRKGFAEREHQIQLAKKRGEAHIGGDVKNIINQRKAKKIEDIKAAQNKNTRL